MELIPLLLSLSLLSVQVHSLDDPRVPDMFFPFGPDEGDRVVPVGDDASSPAVSISTGFPFLFGNHSTVYVSAYVRLITDAVNNLSLIHI